MVLLTNRLPIRTKNDSGELMKRTIKLAVAAAVALTSTAAFATNGDNLIGMGAKTRGMGGVAIGMSHGAESGIANPAMITTVKNNEISFGGTVFMPDVETDMGTGGGSIKSDNDLSVIPEVAIAQKINDNFYWGIGMYGVAGMGVDYSDALNGFDGAATTAAANTAGFNAFMGVMGAGGTMAQAQMAGGYATAGTVFADLAKGNFGMKTNLQLMQFAVPLAFKLDSFSFAIAPILQYGSLDIDYRLPSITMNAAGTAVQSISLTGASTRGVASDLGLGYSAGVSFAEEGLTLGATYKSAINMKYNDVISKAVADFSTDPVTRVQGMYMSDNLEQPSEMGAGISYEIAGNTIAFDYKRVNWASAQGYKDFGWQDQDVYALGYQYAASDWAVRAGWNHSTSPIVSQANTLLNTLNLLGFPATVEDHYTVGGSYAFTKMTSLDLAYVYAPTKTEQYTNMVGATTTTKHSQDAVSMQVNFLF
jgi:long-chain fatty acid transport protein